MDFPLYADHYSPNPNSTVEEQVEEQEKTLTRGERVKEYISGYFNFVYPSGGGTENVDNAALGILILWTTW